MLQCLAPSELGILLVDADYSHRGSPRLSADQIEHSSGLGPSCLLLINSQLCNAFQHWCPLSIASLPECDPPPCPSISSN